MRTNIEIEDELMEQALSVSGKTTKKDVVEAGLQIARADPQADRHSSIAREGRILAGGP